MRIHKERIQIFITYILVQVIACWWIAICVLSFYYYVAGLD